MWKNREFESAPQAPERIPLAAPAPPPAALPPPKVPNVAVIGSTMRITGEIVSHEALVIDGEVDGSLQLEHALTIGPNGKVSANVKARQVTIFGSVSGNVEVTEKITIRDQGSLIGDVKTAGIVIEDGAYFKGSIDILRTRPAANGQPAETAEPAAESPPRVATQSAHS